jgi:hypothetical protein
MRLRWRWSEGIRPARTPAEARNPMTGRFDKSRRPSRYVSVGPDRAPQRSFF